MKKFRKKSVDVQAQQWYPPGDARHDPKAFPVGMDMGYTAIGQIVERQGIAGFVMKTAGGWHDMKEGDWVVVGPDGVRSPCKPNEFEKMYEPAEETVLA